MIRTRLMFALALLLLPLSISLAWEKFTDEELSMKPPDWCPDATAMVLDRQVRGDVSLTAAGFELEVKYVTRIKLFDEAAFDLANIQLLAPAGSKINRIKARTITPEGKKVKLKKRDIYDEITYAGPKNDRKYRVVNFAFPAVTAGAILEFEYRWVSDNFVLMPPFYFDLDGLPTRESSVAFQIPYGLNYRTGLINTAQLDYKEEVTEIQTVNGPRLQYLATVRQFAGVPEEPLMPSTEYLRPHVYFVLAGYETADVRVDLVKDWNRVAEIFEGWCEEYTTWTPATALFVRDLVDGPFDRTALEKLHRFIADSIETVGSRHPFEFDRTIEDVLENRRGTGMEKTLLMRECCRQNGLDCDLLLGVPWDEGGMIADPPIFNRLSASLLRIDLDTQSIYLDPGDEDAPFDYIPWTLAGNRALLVEYDNAEIIRLPDRQQMEEVAISFTGILDDSGALDADCSILLVGGRIRFLGDDLQLLDSEELRDLVAAAWLHDLDAEQIDNIELILEDGTEPRINVHVHVEGVGQLVGDRWVVRPNQFRSVEPDYLPEVADRQTNLNFSSPVSVRIDGTIELPDGVNYTELPETRIKNLEAFGFMVRAGCGSSPGLLQFSRHTRRKHWSFSKTHYESIRDFYSELAEADRLELVCETIPADGMTETDANAEQ